MSIIDSADAIAQATARPNRTPAVRWRWATVTANNGDGTLDVEIDGGTVAGVTASAECRAASAGDRVRVTYLATDAVADVLLGDLPAAAETTQTLSGTGTNYFHAHGTTATLMSAGTSPSAQWGSATVCTIPEGWRPWTPLYFPCVKDGAIVSDTYLIIATDGTVTIQNAGGTQAARNYWCTATWAV